MGDQLLRSQYDEWCGLSLQSHQQCCHPEFRIDLGQLHVFYTTIENAFHLPFLTYNNKGSYLCVSKTIYVTIWDQMHYGVRLDDTKTRNR